jgi:hypothetical protein
MLSVGCDDDPFDDDGSSTQPDFEAFGSSIEPDPDLFISVTASREDGDVDGIGEVVIEGERFSLEVVDANLSTDFGMEDPIPQTDELQPVIICTPAFAELNVILSNGDGDFEATLFLNECEPDNPEMFDENGVIINPCTGEEVTGAEQIEQFRGVCLPDDKDTIVLEEFNGFCGIDSPCIVPIEISIFVPALQD